jgi:hypothetical protein
MPRAGRPKGTGSNARLKAAGCDPLGYLMQEFKAKPSISLAMDLIKYQHGLVPIQSEEGTTKRIVQIVLD